jgi:hypothetical protein
MTQFEQENDLGSGGGDVDDDDLAEAWEERDERLGGDNDPASDAPQSPPVDEEVERRS